MYFELGKLYLFAIISDVKYGNGQENCLVIITLAPQH